MEASEKDTSEVFSGTEETILWKGTPSQWINFMAFISCILIITIPFVFWIWLKTRNRKFEITNERIIETNGVFSRKTSELELYRVKDLQLEEPFFLRLVKLSNIQMLTSDRTNPVYSIPGIPNGVVLKEKLRKAIEHRRDVKRVRETDFE